MTDDSPMIALHLNDLCQNKAERPGWSLTFGATCVEAAAVCLHDRGHSGQVRLQIDGLRTCAIELRWDAIDDTVRRFNADQDVATEYGAYGIAALIMPFLTDLTIIAKSITGKYFQDFFENVMNNAG